LASRDRLVCALTAREDVEEDLACRVSSAGPWLGGDLRGAKKRMTSQRERYRAVGLLFARKKVERKAALVTQGGHRPHRGTQLEHSCLQGGRGPVGVHLRLLTPPIFSRKQRSVVREQRKRHGCRCAARALGATATSEGSGTPAHASVLMAGARCRCLVRDGRRRDERARNKPDSDASRQAPFPRFPVAAKFKFAFKVQSAAAIPFVYPGENCVLHGHRPALASQVPSSPRSQTAFQSDPGPPLVEHFCKPRSPEPPLSYSTTARTASLRVAEA
jgi:hypothetical protein